MTFGTVIVALILVETEIKLRPVLDYSWVERRQKNMVLIVKFGNRHNQQTMILASITVNDGRTGVSTRTIRPKQFLVEAFLKVCHYSLFKS